MPTVVDFSLSDALDAVRAFHALPEDAEVSIEGKTIRQSKGDLIEDLYDSLTHELKHNQMIPTIKMLRTYADIGLKDSKHIVDAMENDPYFDISDFEGHLHKLGVNNNRIETQIRVNNLQPL
jgi:ribosomal protein L7/L12